MNPRKRKIEQNHVNDHNHKARKNYGEDNIDGASNFLTDQTHKNKHPPKNDKQNAGAATNYHAGEATNSKNLSIVTEADKKKHEAEQKRQESMRKKRQEFKEKKMIIKSGLTGVVSIEMFCR